MVRSFFVTASMLCEIAAFAVSVETALGNTGAGSTQVASAANAQAETLQFGDRKIHPLFILADADPEVGPTVRLDARMIAALFSQVPQRNLAEPKFLFQSCKQFRFDQIAAVVESLDTGQSDTIFCFFSGRARVGRGTRSFRLKLDDIDLEPGRLTSILNAKSHRSVVLLTDCIHPDIAVSLSSEVLLLPTTENQYSLFTRLLLSSKGSIDLLSHHRVCPGAAALHFCMQEERAGKIESLGSLFVRELVRECTNEGKHSASIISWRALLLQIHKNARRHVRFLAEVAVDRGDAQRESEEYDEAIADYAEALRLDPKCARAQNHCGIAWSMKNEYEEAIEHYNRAIEIDSERADYFNSLARLLATCPDKRFRNGESAVEHATRACELSKWEDPCFLDTLAAAHAEMGQFKKAVEIQMRALKSASRCERFDEAGARSRLELYRGGKPYGTRGS